MIIQYFTETILVLSHYTKRRDRFVLDKLGMYFVINHDFKVFVLRYSEYCRAFSIFCHISMFQKQQFFNYIWLNNWYRKEFGVDIIDIIDQIFEKYNYEKEHTS